MATMQDIQGARNNAMASSEALNKAVTRGYTVEDDLKTKLNEAYGYNEDIVKPLDEATATYLSAPNVGREKYQNIFNPFTREKLVSQYTGTESLPMLALSNILGIRRGNIGDAITRGSNAYGQYVSGLDTAAKNDRGLYNDLMSEYEAESERAYKDAMLQLNMQKASGSGSGIEDILGYISKLRSQDPTSTQENNAAQAKSVLRDIDLIKKANTEDLKKAALISSQSGTGGIFGKLGLTYGKWTATPEEEELARALQNISTQVRISATGAAFGEREPEMYNLLTQDPVFAYKDPSSLISGLDRLGTYYSEVERLGTNPLQGQINSLNEILRQLIPGSGIDSGRYEVIE